jgi:hypothetical protein
MAAGTRPALCAAAVTFLLAITQGDNFVAITPPPPLSPSLVDVVGIGDSKPFFVSQVVNPAGNPPFILADGSSQATIDYYLFDQWGNPSVDQGIQIVTSAGENKIFYTNDEQKRLATAYIAQLDQQKIFPKPIVTEVAPLKGFYRAEDYHQDYAYYNPDNPYIEVCDRPKIAALKQQFPELFVEYKPKK